MGRSHFPVYHRDPDCDNGVIMATIKQKLSAGAVLVLGAAAILLTTQPKKKPIPPPQDRVTVVGTVKVEKLVGGEVVSAESTNKTLVGVGIRQMIALMIGDSTNAYDTASFICVGIDSTVTDTSMTALQGATKTWGNVDSITHSYNWVKWWRTFTSAQANHLVKEIAIFNDSAGIMLDRGHYDWGVKTTEDTWRTSVKLTFN